MLTLYQTILRKTTRNDSAHTETEMNPTTAPFAPFWRVTVMNTSFVNPVTLVCVPCDIPEHVVEGDVPSVVQALHLIAHVLKQQLVLVQVHLQPASQ